MLRRHANQLSRQRMVPRLLACLHRATEGFVPPPGIQYRGRLSETTTSLPPTFWHRLHTSFDANRFSVMKS
jgi:hypothetical protein